LEEQPSGGSDRRPSRSRGDDPHEHRVRAARFAPFGERFLSIGILTGLYGAIFLGLVAVLLGARTVTIYAPRSLIAFMIGSIAMQGFAQPPAGPLGQLEPYYLAGALLATLSLPVSSR